MSSEISVDIVRNTSGNISVAPVGLSTNVNLWCMNNSDVANSSYIALGVTNTYTYVQAGKTGTGSNLPLTFFTGGLERVRINQSGDVGVGLSPSLWATSNNVRAVELLAGANWSYSTTAYRMVQNAYYSIGDFYVYSTTAPAVQYSQEAGSHIFSTAPSGTAGTTATFTERAKIDVSGNFYFNSGYGSSAIAYGCRAWVNFNGTGTIVTRGSGNVSSVADNGTGDYTINFTTAMPDVNYSVTGICGDSSTAVGVISGPQIYSTGSFRYTTRSDGSVLDFPYQMIQIFR